MKNRMEKLSKLTSLTDWEKQFVTDLLARQEQRGDEFRLSEKQEAVLTKIEKERTK